MIEESPIVEIKNEVVDVTQPTSNIAKQKREYKAKLCHSNFFLTINTNVRFPDRDDMSPAQEFAERLKQSLQDIFNNLQQYLRVAEGTEWNSKFFDSIDVESAVERSPQTNTIHAHILIKVNYRNTKVQLDYGAIKAKICNDLDLTNVYLFNRIYRDAHSNLKDYIYKNRKQVYAQE